MRNETFLEMMERFHERMMDAAEYFKGLLDSEKSEEEPTWNELERNRLQEEMKKLECPYDSGKIKHFKDWD